MGYGEQYVQTTSAHEQAPLPKQWFKDETRNFEMVTAAKDRALLSHCVTEWVAGLGGGPCTPVPLPLL